MAKNTLNVIFSKNASESQEVRALQEEQAVFALKSMDLNKALKYDILPIDYMEKNPLYKGRFEQHVYNSVILKSELAVLDAKEGGHQWLKGDRFKYIRDYKLFKSFGRTNFEDFIKNDTPYAKSTVYNWISIRERFSFEEAVAAGSKLTLLTHDLDISDEQDRKAIMKRLSDSDISYREAKTMISIEREDKGMSVEEIREDAFVDDTDILMVPAKKPQKKDEERTSLFEEIPPVEFSIFRSRFVNDKIELDPNQVKYIKESRRRHLLIVGLGDAVDQRAANEVFNDPGFQRFFSRKVQEVEERYRQEGGQVKDKVRNKPRVYK